MLKLRFLAWLMMFYSVLNSWIKLIDMIQVAQKTYTFFDLVDGSSTGPPQSCTQSVSCSSNWMELYHIIAWPELSLQSKIFPWVWWPELIYICVCPGEIIWSSILSEDISKKDAKLIHTCISVRLVIYHWFLVYFLHHQFL